MNIQKAFLFGALIAAPALANHYAAIAVSESARVYGIGRSTDGFDGADSAALAQCGRDDCFIRAAVHDGCIAFAHDAEWFGVGYSALTTLDEAKQDALMKCYRPGHGPCAVALSFCSEDENLGG